jgi:type II secretory pathway pseudopilin PulG
MANHSTSGKQSTRTQAGFTYLGVLIAIALLGIGLSIVSEVWTKTVERQKRIQLDWVGQQYVQAIQSYYYANTDSIHTYPKTLDDLLEDKRYPSIKRHIRALYPDPFSASVKWRLIGAPTGGFQGVELDDASLDPSLKQQFIFAPCQTGDVSVQKC